MIRRLLSTLFFGIGVIAAWPASAGAEVKLVRPDKAIPNRLAIVSDGAMPWTLRYYSNVGRSGPYIASKLTPVSADRMLFSHGLVLHLIDTKNGIVLRRWTFVDRIEDVRVEGDTFVVTTKGQETQATITITADSPSPPRWIESLLLQRGLINEGSWFDLEARMEPEFKSGLKKYAPREPLAPKDAERLIIEVEDAARRDPFSPQFGVCLALLMQDLGRSDADAVFRRTLEKPTNSYGELFLIALDLENGGLTDWSTLAFDQAYARLWQEGVDPRMISALLPRLMLLYLPYELRLEMPDDRRAKLLERIYSLGPYVEGAPLAWSRLADYFDSRGDSKRAALWRTRAHEASLKSGSVWEPAFYLETALRGLVALILSILLYGLVLHRRYLPQRRLLRGSRTWMSDFRRVSVFQ